MARLEAEVRPAPGCAPEFHQAEAAGYLHESRIATKVRIFGPEHGQDEAGCACRVNREQKVDQLLFPAELGERLRIDENRPPLAHIIAARLVHGALDILGCRIDPGLGDAELGWRRSPTAGA